MSEYDDVMNRLGNVKPTNSRDPFLGDGQHQLIVHSLQEYNDTKWGKSFRVLFYIENSTRHPPGSLAARTFNINKPAMYETQANDADALADFVCVLQGIKLGTQGPSMKALIVPQHAGGNREAQPARGCRINATGQPAKQGINPATQRPYSFTKISYQTVPNDAASIAANRTMLDAKYPVGAPPVVQQAQQTYQPPAPAYQVPQGPVPQSPAYQVPQGHPQTYAPTQVPYQQPTSTYQPPVQAPPGYVPPVQYAPAPIAPAASTQPGTGGFLAMLQPK